MGDTQFDCDCDVVLEMEDMGVGVEEILQYCRAVLSREDLSALIRGLGEIATREPQEAE